MLKILFTCAAFALVLCSCSKNDDGMTAKSTESTKKATPNTGNAVRNDAQSAPRPTPDPLAANGQGGKGAIANRKSNAVAGPNPSRSLADKKWIDFYGIVRKCDAMPSVEKEQCLIDSRDTYRALDFNCTGLSKSHERQCQKYNEELKTAAANPPRPAVTHSTEPTITPASPGDPSAAERNRDSTKQQQDVTGSLTQQKKQN